MIFQIYNFNSILNIYNFNSILKLNIFLMTLIILFFYSSALFTAVFFEDIEIIKLLLATPKIDINYLCILEYFIL